VMFKAVKFVVSVSLNIVELIDVVLNMVAFVVELSPRISQASVFQELSQVDHGSTALKDIPK